MTGLPAVSGPLIATQPIPAPAELPGNYLRHAPEACPATGNTLKKIPVLASDE